MVQKFGGLDMIFLFQEIFLQFHRFWQLTSEYAPEVLYYELEAGDFDPVIKYTSSKLNIIKIDNDPVTKYTSSKLNIMKADNVQNYIKHSLSFILKGQI